MPVFINMPSLSPTMKEGKLSKWLINKGDKITSGDVIAEIETDKATMEIESSDDGFLFEKIVQEGDEKILVNSPIAIIKEEGDTEEKLNTFSKASDIKNTKTIPSDSDGKLNKRDENRDKETQTKEVTKSKNLDISSRIISSPLARRLAEQNNIDLSMIIGSGPKGRIVKDDLKLENLSEGNIIKESSLSGTSNGDAKFKDVPNTNMRKTIAKRLTSSLQEAPHFFLSVDCDISKLNEVRKIINDNNNLKISVNDFVIKASSKALKIVPKSNCSWNDTFIRYYQNYDIAVAVAIDDGLITPIIKNVEMKGLEELSSEVKELALRAKENKLSPEEYQGGNFTVSNLGMFGVKNFTAVINPPQSMILAVGMAEKRPVIINEEVMISEVMTVTLSCDHRVVDGALGAKWLKVFKSLIENPSLMLL